MTPPLGPVLVLGVPARLRVNLLCLSPLVHPELEAVPKPKVHGHDGGGAAGGGGADGGGGGKVGGGSVSGGDGGGGDFGQTSHVAGHSSLIDLP